MENKYIADLPLEEMETQQLMAMLRAEMEKESHDIDKILELIHILEKRDENKPVELGPKSEKAWKDYQSKAISRGKKPLAYRKWIAKAASLVLIVGLLFVLIPQQVTGGSFWKILTRWTDTIFEYVNIGAEPKEPDEYVFKTGDPGLQEVYDTVVAELGVTFPVVPKWLPEGNELTEIEVVETPNKKTVRANFGVDKGETVLVFDKMKVDTSAQFHKSEEQVVKYEVNGNTHNFIRNNDLWIITWSKQNIKCSIYIDCQEVILKEIVKSIY